MSCKKFNSSWPEVGLCSNRTNVQQAMLSNIVTMVLHWICYTILSQLIDIFGIFTNIINIIIFTKQGFKDTVTISLMGLAVSDIGSVAMLLWCNICYTPAFRSLDLPFDSIEVNYLTSGIPHTLFTRITCWITAFITMERCLCIIAPLKVKTILTTKRVTIIIVIIFFMHISTTTPVYVANTLGVKFYPDRNRSLVGLVFREHRDVLEAVSFVINNVSFPLISFIINVVCTILLVYKLRKTTEWRKKSTSNSNADNMSNQNKKVAKMVVMLSTIFIICFIPVSLLFLGLLLEPELFIDGKYKDIIITVGGFGIVLESINSSVNIFVYFKMSSNYRCVFIQLFSKWTIRSIPSCGCCTYSTQTAVPGPGQSIHDIS